LNDGTGTFTNVTATHFPVLTLNSFSSAAADVDADGDLDLFFSDSGATTFGGTGGQTRLFINDGTGHFANETAARMPAVNIVAAVDLNVADVDGDFDIDVMVVSRDGSPSKMFKNDGRGFFVEAPLPSDGSGTYEYEIGDVDGDSDADVFVIGVSGLTEGTFVNDGTGTFTLGVGTVVGNASSDDNDAALGDVDSDGDWDCAVAALSTAERFFLNNGAGVFTFQAGFVTAFVDSSMDGEFADVDDDGDLDYLSAVGESGAFQNRIYINTSATAADNDAPTFRLPAYGPQTPFGPLMVRVGVRDVMATDGDPEYQSVTLHWTVGGVPGSAPMTWAGADLFQALMPGGAQGVPITLYAECTDRAGNLGTSATAAFSPLAFPPVVLSVTTTGVGDVTITLDAPMQAFAEEYVLVSAATNLPLGAGPFLGLGADALLWFNLPFGVAPFHYFLDVNGHLASSFPAGTLPLGLTLDARAVTFPLGPPQLSNLVRRSF
ncbi:MAG TPA: VCBS repeat-containing protein, partial [Planctomycetota bacterium]|nr:VCBS repeat-containing protein [Planctomycetota bacterium]